MSGSFVVEERKSVMAVDMKVAGDARGIVDELSGWRTEQRLWLMGRSVNVGAGESSREGGGSDVLNTLLK
jgi:hypothetical protein